VDERAARDVWASFQHDPRDPAVASLRASDADRNVVHNVLTEAFADGRLDREEYDERSAATLQARTLGQLPPLVADLVPDRPLLPTKVPLRAASSTDIQRRAEAKWREDRRGAFLGFVGSALITWAIWLAINWGELAQHPFPWPLIVNAFALMNLIRVSAGRSEIVNHEVQRLERKRAREIEAQNKKQLGQ
jgi:hypothetical protein